MWKIIFSLVLVVSLLFPVFAANMVKAQKEPADLLDIEFWINELLPAFRDNLVAFLPEALWTFIRACICGGLIPALIDLPKTLFDVSPTGTLLGFGCGMISCCLLFIPGCLLGMYADSEQWH